MIECVVANGVIMAGTGLAYPANAPSACFTLYTIGQTITLSTFDAQRLAQLGTVTISG